MKKWGLELILKDAFLKITFSEILLSSTSFLRCNLTLEAPKIPETPAVSQFYIKFKYLKILKFNKQKQGYSKFMSTYGNINSKISWGLCLTKGKCKIISVQLLMQTCHSKLLHISLHLTVFIGNLTLTLKKDHCSSWIKLIRRKISS